MASSARKYDLNGWFEAKGNPLSKVGIYDYSGAQIGAPAADAGKIFKVYRPAEELSREETLDSFKLIPFIDDHTMLGDGFEDAGKVGVAGVIGQDVYFEAGTLYGNPKVYSKALAEKIKSGKTELSCGYRCRYDFTPGVWNGEHYDVIQRDIRGNHLALVDEGRMGPEVSILDHLTFAVDAKELTPVDPKLEELLAKIMERLDALEAAMKPADEPVADADADKPADEPVADADADKPADEPAEDADKTPVSMDAALKQIASLRGEVSALRTRPAMDERAVMSAMDARTDLVSRLSKVVGTFDSAGMTTADIAAYGIKKLDIKGVAKGQEVVALDAFLQAKGDPSKVPSTVAQDKAPSGLATRIASHGAGA